MQLIEYVLTINKTHGIILCVKFDSPSGQPAHSLEVTKMAEFDTETLVDRIIRQQRLSAQTITGRRGRLQIDPRVARHICAAVGELTPANRESIARQGLRFNESGLQSGFRAMDIDPARSLPLTLMHQVPAAVVVLEIATQLRVTIR